MRSGASGLPTPGERLTGRLESEDFTAVVEPDGQLHVLGKGHADSPSAAVKLACLKPRDG